MITRKPYTADECLLILKLREDGCQANEIAEKTGRTVNAIYSFFQHYKDGNLPLRQVDKAFKEREAAVAGPKEQVAPVPVKQKTLDDFSPREMIKHLYGKGYRIINGEIYQVVKTKINLSDIIR